MAHTENNIEALVGSQEAFEQLVKERLRQAVRVALINVLEEEVTAFIGVQPYERSELRRDQRNGHYTRNLETTVGQLPDLPVPRTRHGYQTQLFERYHRRRDELDTAIGEMFVGGVSMAKVGQVVETLTGSTPSASTVSRVFHSLESEYAEWKQRTLAQRYAYAFADGTYFTVIYNGEGCKMPILAVIGIAETGEREVLAFRVGDRENEQAWKDLLEDLKQRGVKGSACGLVMATRPCSMPSLPNLARLPDNAVWCTRWTMCSATFPTNSRTRSNPSYVPCFTRKTVKPLIRRWQPSSRNTRRSIPQPSSACSVIWRRV